MTVPALQVSGVTSGYGSAVVLRELSLTVAPGEAVALLGKNGMGKSTLLKTVMGFLPKMSGKVMFNGTDITHDSPYAVARRGITYAAQEQSLFTELSVRDNLTLGLPTAADFEERFPSIEPLFPVFGNRLEQLAGTLSGGEQKMLLVARALMMRPTLLVFDEITEGLQPTVIERILQALLAQRREHGTAMLLVEQHVPFALGLAERWLLLERGEIADSGGARERGAADAIYEQLRV